MSAFKFAPCVLFVALAACAAAPPEDAAHGLNSVLGTRAGGKLESARGLTAEQRAVTTDTLLAKPLSLDDALRLALLNAPRYRTLSARVAVAAAERDTAGAWSNPIVSAKLRPSTVGLANLEFGVLESLVDLFTQPARMRAATARFKAEQLSVAAEIVGAATDVRRAYVTAVAAAQIAAVETESAAAAEAAAALAARFHEAGNLPLAALRQAQATAATARLSRDDAVRNSAEAREDLALVLGVAAPERITLPETMPELPQGTPALASGDPLAVQAARALRDAAVTELRAKAGARLWREAGLEVSGERDPDGTWSIGPTLSLALPIFNNGGATVARAAAAAEQADAECRMAELKAASELRLATARVGRARARAEAYRAEIVPLQHEVVDLTLREYNYMLTGAFALLEARRTASAAERGLAEAVRDYWLARVDLDAAAGGGTAAGKLGTEERP